MTPKEEPRRMRRQAGEGNGSNGDAAASSISARLKAARDARGIDLFRVERDTKIRVKFLTALEEGQFSELPAEVYARGFLRNYATYLGMDPDEAWEEWRRESAVPHPSASLVLPSLARQPGGQTRGRTAEPGVGQPLGGTPGNGGAPGVEVPAARSVVVKLPELKLPQFKLPSAGFRTPKLPPAEAQARLPRSEPSILQSPPNSTNPWAIRFADLLSWRPGRTAPVSPIGGPEPISMPRRTLVFGPTHLLALLLIVAISGVGIYFIAQATRVLQDPPLTVTSPAQRNTTVPAGTTTFQLAGKAAPHADISVNWDQQEAMHVQADAAGKWSYKATLHKGPNLYDIHSTDINTGRDSATVSLIITVETPTASPVPVQLQVDSPTPNQYFGNGTINVYGTTVALTSVTITATYAGVAPAPTPSGGIAGPTRTPAPTAIPTIMPMPTDTPLASPAATHRATPTPNASNAPGSQTVIPLVDGRFSATLHLYSGRWTLTVIGTNKDGVSTPPDVRTIVVTAGSLVVLVQAKGSPGADMRIWKDGRLMSGYTPFKHFGSGDSVTIVANQSVWIWTRIPRNTYVTINGVYYGHLGPGNQAASWRMTAFTLPTLSNDH
jgi:hypothetical protein